MTARTAGQPGAATGRRARGFTLIEVLVAIGIFALIGVAAAGLLGRTLDMRVLTEARSERLLDVQRAVARFERDALQFADRPVRDEFGDALPSLVLAEGAIEFTTRGRRNPLELQRSALMRVRWQLDERGVLKRQLWPVLDRAQDTRPFDQTILEDVRELEFEVIAADGGLNFDWPLESLPAEPRPGEVPTAGPEAVARALRMVLDVEPWGRIERLLRLPEPAAIGDDTPAGGSAPTTQDAAEPAAPTTTADAADG